MGKLEGWLYMYVKLYWYVGTLGQKRLAKCVCFLKRLLFHVTIGPTSSTVSNEYGGRWPSNNLRTMIE